MTAESATAGCVLDAAGALGRLGGDRQLFADMVGFFFEDAPRLFSDLGEAALQQNASAVRMCAHALKGLVAGCGGVRAASAAQKVETAGQENDLSKIAPLVEALGGELELLKQALQPYRA